MSELLEELAGGVKGRILSVLSGRPSLSVKEVFYEVKRSGLDVSYQAVHKALSQLEADKVVLKEESRYSISKHWLSGLSQEVSGIITSREAKDFSIITGPRGGIASKWRAVSLLKRMLLEGQMTLSHDEFFMFGNRVGFLPHYMYIHWYRDFKKLKPNSIYYGARKLGVRWFHNIRRLGFSKGDFEHEFQLGLDSLSMAGWGGINLESYDVGKKLLMVTLDYSPFSAEYIQDFGESASPVDDIVRGCLSGGFSVIIGEPTLECVERTCIACGDDKCVFEIRPKADFPKSDRQAQAQLKS